MAVAYDNSAKVSTGGTSTASMVITFNAAANTMLLVGIGAMTNVSVSAVLCNGVALTQYARCLNDGSNLNATLFVLTACPTGTLSISAQMTGAVAASMCMGGATYTGAKNTNPLNAAVGMSAGAVAFADISISSSANDMVVLFATSVNNMTCTNATTRLTDGQHFNFKWCDAAGAAPGVSLSASCVNTGTTLAWLGFNIQQSAAAGQSVCFMTLSGVGN